nr:MAG TPA: hypothetical protein [Caudoviricetes sp.]
MNIVCSVDNAGKVVVHYHLTYLLPLCVAYQKPKRAPRWGSFY